MRTVSKNAAVNRRLLGRASGRGRSAEYPFQPIGTRIVVATPAEMAMAAVSSAAVGLAPPICGVDV